MQNAECRMQNAKWRDARRASLQRYAPQSAQSFKSKKSFLLLRFQLKEKAVSVCFSMRFIKYRSCEDGLHRERGACVVSYLQGGSLAFNPT